MVHGRSDAQLAAAGRVNEDSATLGARRQLGDKRAFYDLAGAGVPGALAEDRLVGDELGLQHDVDGMVEGLDLVPDRCHRAVDQRDKARGPDAQRAVGGRLPDDLTPEHAGL